MLVLTRKENESIIIGGNIRVSILGIEGDKVKIGVDAPVSMRIFREEIIKKTGEENQMALHSSLFTLDLRFPENIKAPQAEEV